VLLASASFPARTGDERSARAGSARTTRRASCRRCGSRPRAARSPARSAPTGRPSSTTRTGGHATPSPCTRWPAELRLPRVHVRAPVLRRVGVERRDREPVERPAIAASISGIGGVQSLPCSPSGASHTPSSNRCPSSDAAPDQRRRVRLALEPAAGTVEPERHHVPIRDRLGRLEPVRNANRPAHVGWSIHASEACVIWFSQSARANCMFVSNSASTDAAMCPRSTQPGRLHGGSWIAHRFDVRRIAVSDLEAAHQRVRVERVRLRRRLAMVEVHAAVLRAALRPRRLDVQVGRHRVLRDRPGPA
jgi:hypothetical protein